MRRAVVALLVAGRGVAATCPNACSGHGSCGLDNVCICDTGYTFAADCSLRQCASGPAWADKAYAENTAHSPAECSNAGVCDRTTGACACFPSFTGAACQRSSCPNGCSTHGVCLTLADASVTAGADYVHPLTTGGDGLGTAYTNWDKEAITLCQCDAGFFGPDCSMMMCPKADDPVTINQAYRKIDITVKSTDGTLAGNIKLSFLGYTTTWTTVQANMDNAKCKTAIEKLANVKTAACVKTDVTGGAKYTVEFQEWPLAPRENNMHSHTGNPPLAAFTCDVSGVTVSGGSNKQCFLEDVVAADTVEYEFCARRGVCDFTAGLCYCLEGYTGEACTGQSYVYSTSNALPALRVDVAGNDYTGNAIEVRGEKAGQADFSLLDLQTGGSTLLNVLGDGHVSMQKLKVLTGGGTVYNGGLKVEQGGLTVNGEGAAIDGKSPSGPVAAIKATSASFANSALTVRADRTTSTSSYELISAGGATDATNAVFTVRGDGKTTVKAGGLDLTGGLTVQSGGLKIVAGGLTLAAGGAGMVTASSSTPAAVATSTVASPSSSSVVLKVEATAAAPGDYRLLDVYTQNAANNAAQRIFSVSGEPKTYVELGGLEVSAGGAKIYGGATVASGGMTISAVGLNIAAGGLTVAGDVGIGGALTKASGTFDIEHPLFGDPQRRLRHSFVESPRVDNVYIGEAALNATGFASVDLDAYFALTAGTFAALNGKPRVLVGGNDCLTGFAIEGSALSVWSRPALEPLGLYCGAGAVVTFHVTAERRDAHILESKMTDADGRLVPEYERGAGL